VKQVDCVSIIDVLVINEIYITFELHCIKKVGQW